MFADLIKKFNRTCKNFLGDKVIEFEIYLIRSQ